MTAFKMSETRVLKNHVRRKRNGPEVIIVLETPTNVPIGLHWVRWNHMIKTNKSYHQSFYLTRLNIKLAYNLTVGQSFCQA